MREQIKAALSQKIDSKEKFDNVLTTHRLSHYIRPDGRYSLDGISNYTCPHHRGEMRLSHDWYAPNSLWWWVREAMREYYGVYQRVEDSTVLTQLFNLVSFRIYFPHVSIEDPTRIAVTMSADDGARDKQTTIALGRFLKRVMFFLPDADIQALEATHRADMSNELEIVRTPEEIEAVYTGMRGDTGCMRHDKSRWGHPKHPSVVYASAGYGVAVVRDANGEVVARSVVYENPNDPADKRYVRLYGDPSLKRRLERNGYRLAGTAGTSFDAHPTGNGENTWIIPYLDVPGGGGAGCTDKRHAGVVYRGGRIHVIDSTEYRRIENALAARGISTTGMLVSNVEYTTACARLAPLPEDLFTYRCAITGQQYSTDESVGVRVWHNERVGTAHPSEVEGWIEARVFRQGVRVVARVHPDTPLFEHQGAMFVESQSTREMLGYVKLDAQLYPTEQDWQYWGDAFARTADSRVVKREDCVVVNTTGAVVVRLKTDKDASWVRLRASSKYQGMEIWATPDSNHGVTRSGAKVGRYTHDVAEVYGGGLEFSRNVKRTRLLCGAGFATLHKDTPMEEIARISKEQLVARLATMLDEFKSNAVMPSLEMQRRIVARLTDLSYYPHLVDGSRSRGYVSSADRLADVIAGYEAYAQVDVTDRWQFGLGAISDLQVEVALYILRILRDELTELSARLNPEPAPTDRFVVAA